MAKVKFGDSSTVYDIYISMGYKYLTLIFNSKEERDKVDFSQGCYEINEYNGMIMGDFSNYKYVYQEDENRVILTPNEPICGLIISFVLKFSVTKTSNFFI